MKRSPQGRWIAVKGAVFALALFAAPAWADLYIGATYGAARFDGQENVSDGIAAVLERERFDIYRDEDRTDSSPGLLIGYKFQRGNARLRVEWEYVDLGSHTSRIDAFMENEDFFGFHISEGYFWSTTTTSIESLTLSLMPGWAFGKHSVFLKYGVSRWEAETLCLEWSQLVGRTPEVVVNRGHNGEWGVFAKAHGTGEVLGLAYEYRATDSVSLRVFADRFSKLGATGHVLADSADVEDRPVIRAGFGLILSF